MHELADIESELFASYRSTHRFGALAAQLLDSIRA
jgi:hypothetical protein